MINLAEFSAPKAPSECKFLTSRHPSLFPLFRFLSDHGILADIVLNDLAWRLRHHSFAPRCLFQVIRCVHALVHPRDSYRRLFVRCSTANLIGSPHVRLGQTNVGDAYNALQAPARSSVGVTRTRSRFAEPAGRNLRGRAFTPSLYWTLWL